MHSLRGHFLVPTTRNPDKGLWFIFHHEPDGVLAFDVTREHPDIPFRHFEHALNGPYFPGSVLIGGENQSDSAMLFLHNNPADNTGSHIINGDFSFLSFRYVPAQGGPPSLTKSDETPAKIFLRENTHFQIVMGFRVWEMDALETELKNWQWNLLPAAADIIFQTKPQDRLQRALRSIN